MHNTCMVASGQFNLDKAHKTVELFRILDIDSKLATGGMF